MDGLVGKLVKRLRDSPDAPTVVGLKGEEADQMFDALASETSRAVLSACYKEGKTQSELADELGLSLQNVGYHVKKLETADLLEVAEIRYGENQRELQVYKPSKEAVVIAGGKSNTQQRIMETIEELFAPTLVIGLFSIAVAILVRGPNQIGLLQQGTDQSSFGIESTLLVSLVGLTVFFTGIALLFFAIVLKDRQRSSEMTFTVQRRVTRTLGVIVGLFLLGFIVSDLWASGRYDFALVLTASTPLIGFCFSAVSSYKGREFAYCYGVATSLVMGVWTYFITSEIIQWGISILPVLISFSAFLAVGGVVGVVGFAVGKFIRTWLC